MRELRTEIEIDGTAEEVWAVLADLDTYREWNPFVTEIGGQLRRGERLHVRLSPVEERAMTLRPVVLVAEPGSELRWLGRLPIPGLFSGEHVMEIRSARPGRVRFLHHERFRGALLPLMWRKLRDGGTAKGFVLMNEALAARVAARRPAA